VSTGKLLDELVERVGVRGTFTHETINGEKGLVGAAEIIEYPSHPVQVFVTIDDLITCPNSMEIPWVTQTNAEPLTPKFEYFETVLRRETTSGIVVTSGGIFFLRPGGGEVDIDKAREIYDLAMSIKCVFEAPDAGEQRTMYQLTPQSAIVASEGDVEKIKELRKSLGVLDGGPTDHISTDGEMYSISKCMLKAFDVSKSIEDVLNEVGRHFPGFTIQNGLSQIG
jgi:hypothetical protein